MQFLRGLRPNVAICVVQRCRLTAALPRSRTPAHTYACWHVDIQAGRTEGIHAGTHAGEKARMHARGGADFRQAGTQADTQHAHAQARRNINAQAHGTHASRTHTHICTTLFRHGVGLLDAVPELARNIDAGTGETAHAACQLLPRSCKLTWLVLGGDPAVCSRRVEQFTAL